MINRNIFEKKRRQINIDQIIKEKVKKEGFYLMI